MSARVPFAARHGSVTPSSFAARSSQSAVRHAARVVAEELEGRRMLTSVYALTTGNTAFVFDDAAPGAVAGIALTGVGTDQIVGIDFRPSTGELFGVGVTGTNVTTYVIDRVTGAATAKGTAAVPGLTGATKFGVDFNPVADRIRVTTDLASDGDAAGNTNNFRLNPNDGTLIAVDPDLNFSGLPGSPAPVAEVAYTNSAAGAAPATTTLYSILSGGDRLVSHATAPGFQTLVNVGAISIDTSSSVGFDIYGPSNTAIASLNDGAFNYLYSINLATGASTLKGTLGIATSVIGLAAVPANATLVVTNNANSGAGSLRAAITAANTLPGPDTITFNIPGAGPHVIQPTTALPAIVDKVLIDGKSEPDFAAAGKPVVVLDGSLAGGGADGLSLTGSADGTVIRGLQIFRFSANGIYVYQARDVQIYCNYIGTDGIIGLGNGSAGVYITESATNNIIGGAGAAYRNVISGNAVGVRIVEFSGISPVATVVQGNYIGLNAAGDAAIPNTNHGISLEGADDSQIGGTAPGEGNVISGNLVTGISITFNSVGITVQGNLIGTNAAGLAPSPSLGNQGSGIDISADSAFGTIGGTTPGARNIITNNGAAGILIVGNFFAIQGNYIGPDITGTAGPGNGLHGIEVAGFNNRIGGPLPSLGNIIAFNDDAGIGLQSGQASSVEMRLNSIHSNRGLGIDLEINGVTPNDPGDSDGTSLMFLYPNELQNFPVLGSAIVFGGLTTVQGSLNSNGNENFLIDFYGNAAFDPSTYGEGQTYLGTVAITTNGSGNATFSAGFPVLPAGQYITATATRTTSDYPLTSEFSQPVQVIAPTPPPTPPNPTISVAADVSQNEGTGPNTTLTFTVTRTGDTTAASSVNFATADGTATNGSDYFGQSGTLNFAPGETSKPVNITVVADSAIETDEQFVLNLTGATGGTIGDNQAVGTIVNDDFPPPVFSIDDVTLAEGNGAGTTAFTFTVTRSGSAGSLASPSSVQVQTANDTAAAGSDFAAVPLTTVNFAVNQTTQNVTVQVARDAVFESDETFFVNLVTPTGATISDGQGKGTITNDDAAPLATAVLGPDPGAPGKTALIITGTDNGEFIDLDPGTSSSFLKVKVDGVQIGGQFNVNTFSRIFIDAKGGNDQIAVTARTTKDTLILGGAGNDTIKGGYGKDILLGGIGNDIVSGRKGRDFIIGGGDADGISGDEDDDLLVAAATIFDADFVALTAIQKEWTSSNSYSKRRDNVRNGTGSNVGGRMLNDASILEDSAFDQLSGNSGTDLFFYHKSNGVGNVADKLLDKSSSETAVDAN